MAFFVKTLDYKTSINKRKRRNISEFEKLFLEINKFLSVLNGSYFDFFGRLGSPWEFNLRDLMRWCDMVIYLIYGDYDSVTRIFSTDNSSNGFSSSLNEKILIAVYYSFIVLFYHRFRSLKDRKIVLLIFCVIFEFLDFEFLPFFSPSISFDNINSNYDKFLLVGINLIRKSSVGKNDFSLKPFSHFSNFYTFPLSSLIHALNSSILVIISGSSLCGKTFFVRNLFGLF
jgi:midasin (ATPase involved in ribosome maturation)